jgi:hypothetical protein
MDFSFLLGFFAALFYGITHLCYPNLVAMSWGLSEPWQSETKDFVQLLGIWILFQSMVALTIPVFVKDLNVKFLFTLIHVIKNLGAFVVRYRMQERYYFKNLSETTNGFKISLYADLFFAIIYGLAALLHYVFSYKKIVKKVR